VRFPWRRHQPDPQRFAQTGSPRMTRDASPEVVEHYGSQIAAVSQLLFQHDPIDINFDFNSDEYDPEARTIVARLATFHGTLTRGDVLTIVHEEFVAWFGPEIAGEEQRYFAIADDLFSRWPGWLESLGSDISSLEDVSN